MEPIEHQVEALLAQLTLREKVALLSGQDNWATVANERLGIPSIIMTDGPHGVRATPEGGRKDGPTTAFPTGVSMAATWNPDLIEAAAGAMAAETRAMGCDVLLGPCVNIVRHPLAGRNFETYTEDPHLAGRIGVAYVRGLQNNGVGASLKHFACNNQETERDRGSSEVDERAFREIYLPHFEMVVREANPWTVMCAYNRINGVYASENRRLLREILKGEWGYDGAVISDWGANHSVYASVAAGLDLEMPGPARYFGSLLVEAVKKWQIDSETVDDAARRMIRLVLRARAGSSWAGAVNTPEHQALARRVAEESIVLLKNEGGLLPLQPDKLRSVALIGPNAAAAVVSGGGSAMVEPPYKVSILDGLRSRLGGQVELLHEVGCENRVNQPILSGAWHGRYYAGDAFAGEPLLERVDERINFWWFSFAPLADTPQVYSVRWTGTLTPPQDGEYVLTSSSTGLLRVFLDEAEVHANQAPVLTDSNPAQRIESRVRLAAGKPYAIRIDYIRPAGVEWPHLQLRFAPDQAHEEAGQIARAVQAARQADVAVVCVGYPPEFENEGTDRPHIYLTRRQDELVRAVAAANPNTVVVLNTGAPVAMDWLDQVPAVVEAFYPGMEGGNAIAAVLLGEVNPSGKLTVTFPRRLEDTPAFTNFPGGRQVLYGESIFVGYRYYDQKDLAPLFPFGHGLSYTSFAYGALQVPAQARLGEPVQVSLTVTNTGERAGQEVVQLYLSDPVSTLPRPPRELKAFAKVALAPGESRAVTFTLEPRAFAFYDPRRGWVAEPGEFILQAGSSSRDLRSSATVALT